MMNSSDACLIIFWDKPGRLTNLGLLPSMGEKYIAFWLSTQHTNCCCGPCSTTSHTRPHRLLPLYISTFTRAPSRAQRRLFIPWIIIGDSFALSGIAVHILKDILSK